MIRYVIANKDKTKFLKWESFGSSHFLEIEGEKIWEAYMLDTADQARTVLYEWLQNRGGKKDINNYQIVKIEIKTIYDKIDECSPINYSEPFKFSYTTDEYAEEKIIKEKVSSMLDFLFGIKETNFTYTAKLCDLRSRTHTAKIIVNFKKEEK